MDSPAGDLAIVIPGELDQPLFLPSMEQRGQHPVVPLELIPLPGHLPGRPVRVDMGDQPGEQGADHGTRQGAGELLDPQEIGVHTTTRFVREPWVKPE